MYLCDMIEKSIKDMLLSANDEDFQLAMGYIATKEYDLELKQAVEVLLDGGYNGVHYEKGTNNWVRKKSFPHIVLKDRYEQD